MNIDIKYVTVKIVWDSQNLMEKRGIGIDMTPYAIWLHYCPLILRTMLVYFENIIFFIKI